MKQTKKYVSVDNKEFDTEEACIAHERTISKNSNESIITTYVHGDKESLYELFREKGIIFANEDAQRLAAFATMEFELEILISHKTGESKLLSVGGKKLVE